ncbi:MAG TPA: DinB family protein [Phototrophicaceae bacterium]|nr:DinB family protein [Phototrophicaceae bacterium]
MSDPHRKDEIVAQLRQVQQGISQTAQAIPTAQFFQGTAEAWSPCDYLKHLLLAVKPFAKGLNYPPEQIGTLFGVPDHPSRSFAEVGAVYQAQLSRGLRAEDVPNMLPVGYRMPEGVTDVQIYLIESWNDAHVKLYAGLSHWSEADLDSHQFNHAALGLMTVREILFFTIYHNTMHWHDIQVAAQPAQA